MVDEDEIVFGSTVKAVKARFPWLFITLIGQLIASNVVNKFETTLNAVPVIAIFMPLLAGLGGNIGTQSITIIIRGLSTGQLNMSSAIHQICRELRVGIIIGTMFGVLVTLYTWQWKHNIDFGIVVGVSMAINMSVATLLGAITPFLLKKFKIDPAIASGPVIATIIDVFGIAIYFTLVTLYLMKIM